MKLTHTDNEGKARMVDISEKPINVRTAEATAKVRMSSESFNAVKNNSISKGDVLAVARIGAIQAGKRTSDIIPLCHNIPISTLDIEFDLSETEHSITVKSLAKTVAATGIEMEAITSATIAAVIIYDMCKAIDKGITISDIKLLSKTGGKSGDFNNE